MYIDTHAHLDFPELEPHLTSVLINAKLARVHTIITIGIDRQTNQNALNIAQVSENVYASIGWHPHDASKADDGLEEHIRTLSKHKKVVAIGEIGLDYYRNHSPHDVQRNVFSRMIHLASELDLPIIVHCRNAFAQTLEIIRNERTEKTRGVFHCFAGDVKELHQVLELGFHASFTGNITYTGNRLHPTVKATPIDRIMLETDCPFLAPHPHRGKRNEPAYIPLIAQQIAEIKAVSLEVVAAMTTKNAESLFHLSSN